MDEEKKDELESENQDDGGETGENKTTEKGQPDYKKIAEDQRKRAEIAEAKLKEKPPEQINNPNADPDELRLIARGLSDEEIEQAKIIAKGLGKSLNEAIKSDLFKVYQADLKDKERKEKAKLGASKGSSQADETTFKPGQSRDDHKEAWKKAMGR